MALRSQIVPLSVFNSDNFDVNKVQANFKKTIESILASGIIDGLLISDVSLSSGSYSLVAHKLGRPVRGYIAVKKSASAVVFDDETGNTQKDLFVKLTASANVTVTLWVF